MFLACVAGESMATRSAARSGASSPERRAARGRGLEAESLVADALVSRGWSVLARNWRGGGAELDIVASRGDRLRFVEVKARDAVVDAVDAVSDDKQRRLSAGAEAYLAAHPAPWQESAFLLAMVSFDAEPWSITWIDDAFDAR